MCLWQKYHGNTVWKYVTNNVQKYRPQNTAKEEFQKLQLPDGRNCTKLHTTTSYKDQTATVCRLHPSSPACVTTWVKRLERGAVKSSIVFECLSIRIFPMI